MTDWCESLDNENRRTKTSKKHTTAFNQQTHTIALNQAN